MEVDVKENKGITIVRPSESRIDAKVAVKFKEELTNLIDSGKTKLALDLGGVDFIDSSGLGATVSVLKHITGKGNMVLFGIQDSVKTMFKLTRMDKVFKIYDDEEEAVANLI